MSGKGGKTMADIIRTAWHKSGLSMKALSVQAGVPYASVHGVLTGDRDPHLSTAEKMCRVLGLTLVMSERKGR